MAIPRQVQAKLDEAERISKQLSEGQQQPKVEEVVEPKAEASKPAEEAGSEKVTEPEQKPKAEETKPKLEAKEEPEKPKDDEVALWKQKYKTLQGMYDREVPELRTRLKQFETRATELEDQLKSLKEQRKQESLVTDEDVSNFGEDLIDVQRRVAKEEALKWEERIEAIQAENKRLREKLESTDSNVQRSTFETRLFRLVPDFNEVDADPRWIAWLDEFDPVLRGQRRAVAMQAYNAGDAEAVADYVKLWRSTLETKEPTKPAKPVEELERQIQPPRSNAQRAQQGNKERTYTSKEVQGMFQKITRLHAAGRSDEANKLEAEIDAAYASGRVAG